jgi:hypothetical protein
MKTNKIFLFSISFTFIILINILGTIKNFDTDKYNRVNESLRFLGDSEIKFICEFPFTCGNGYITSKRICNDISNTLRKRNLNIVEILEPKNVNTNKRDYSRDEYFNIFVSFDNRKILIATNNKDSFAFNKNLIDYPNKFISGFGVPNDKDFTQKFELIESIENGILKSK